MLSENKHNPQFVHQMLESTARKRALHLLNNCKPEHPPDIYFIRRNDRLMDKYMDKDEMKQLIKEADPRLKNNYNLFRLNKKE